MIKKDKLEIQITNENVKLCVLKSILNVEQLKKVEEFFPKETYEKILSYQKQIQDLINKVPISRKEKRKNIYDEIDKNKIQKIDNNDNSSI